MSCREIEEIEEDNNEIVLDNDTSTKESRDIYVAVGKNDANVVKWALDNAVSPGGRVFLVHVFPPVSYIPTPAGRLARSQLSQEHVQVYINEESNKRKNLLLEYTRLCHEAKVVVETMLLESKEAGKAILDLIPVVHISHLVMGTKRSPIQRLLGRRQSTGEYVQKNAPSYCNVAIVYEGKKLKGEYKRVIIDSQIKEATGSVTMAIEQNERPANSLFSECLCFSRKFL
ncbi:hypothetical protein Leryth_006543 [Lithospermum erythrorhizon]|uniref:UspA domain-containing protein n=1 Tax=Lithospermum erythrorhizon TaxID=34254 RepID=A0AAV3NH01_LITER|nr:hypothetical protein Leryth_006543 [Lithospermum erythrorhizon]